MDSTDVSKIALKMALSTRSEEAELKQTYRNMKVKVCAVDFGGNLINSIDKIIERALVAAKRKLNQGKRACIRGRINRCNSGSTFSGFTKGHRF